MQHGIAYLNLSSRLDDLIVLELHAHHARLDRPRVDARF
jgi:hypothetical protein